MMICFLFGNHHLFGIFDKFLGKGIQDAIARSVLANINLSQIFIELDEHIMDLYHCFIDFECVKEWPMSKSDTSPVNTKQIVH